MITTMLIKLFKYTKMARIFFCEAFVNLFCAVVQSFNLLFQIFKR